MDARPQSGPWTLAGVGALGVVFGGIAVLLGARTGQGELGERTLGASSAVWPSASASTLSEPGPSASVAGPASTTLVEAVARTRGTVVNLRAGSQLGAGVIVDPSGVVLTNCHVVKDAVASTTLRQQERPTPAAVVTFDDGRELPAEILLLDRDEDIALLRLRSPDVKETFPSAVLGRSSALAVGQDVFAIGNPFGLPHTVSRGVVSALDRTDVLPNRQLPTIQLDAAINVGNSGGPLFSMDGTLVGITTARTARGSGIAFAIPIDHVRAFLQAVLAGQISRYGMIGLEVDSRQVEDDRVVAAGYAIGIAVRDVEPDSPAARAGLRTGDVIVELRGRRLEGADAPAGEFVTAIRALFPGERIGVTLLRAGEVLHKEIEIAAADDRRQALIEAELLLGLQLEPETLVVGRVLPASYLQPAARTIQGARIVQLVGQPIGGVDELTALLIRARGLLGEGKPQISVRFRRPDGKELGWMVPVSVR